MRYLRRLIWFIASRLLVILLVLGLLTVAFYFSMNATNIYIIIKDGMARRAQVIMMDEPVSQLDNYFLPAGLPATTGCKARSITWIPTATAR